MLDEPRVHTRIVAPKKVENIDGFRFRCISEGFRGQGLGGGAGGG